MAVTAYAVLHPGADICKAHHHRYAEQDRKEEVGYVVVSAKDECQCGCTARGMDRIGNGHRHDGQRHRYTAGYPTELVEAIKVLKYYYDAQPDNRRKQMTQEYVFRPGELCFGSCEHKYARGTEGGNKIMVR